VDLRTDHLAAVVEDNIEKHPILLTLFRGHSPNISFPLVPDSRQQS
jgi:hypothetical protein